VGGVDTVPDVTAAACARTEGDEASWIPYPVTAMRQVSLGANAPGGGSTPAGSRRALAVLSVHASPLGELGKGENGGMNLSIRRLCEGLAARGIPSDVFVRRDDPDAPTEELISSGSRLVRLDAGPPRPLAKEAILGHLPQFTSALLAHAASEARDYRLVHSHYWLSGWVASRAVQRWSVPWVHSFHTLSRTKVAAGLPDDPVRAEVEAVLAQKADRLVAGSTQEELDLERLYGIAPDKVCVVPLGVDVDDFAPRAVSAVRRRLGLCGKRVVLYVGRLERLKGADTLLETVADLTSRPSFDDVHTLLVGADSGDGLRQSGHPEGERGRLEALAASLGVADRVTFLGAVPHADLADLYAVADVCVVPSRAETFGLVALEAQASATPVVAAAVGGLLDIVEDGVTGFLVRGREPRDFADHIARVLDSTVLRLGMGDAARERAAQFTWTRSVDRLQLLYDCVEDPEPAHALESCGCL
jgi:D-inositol-3-phosphate glycosyltransferase